MEQEQQEAGGEKKGDGLDDVNKEIEMLDRGINKKQDEYKSMD